MFRISVLLLVLISSGCKLEEYKQKVKGLLGIEKKQEFNIVMPRIPKIVANSKKVEESRKKIITQFDNLSSDEKRKYHLAFIQEIHLVTRRGLPSNQEASRWLNVLSQGGTREGMYRALVLDEHYLTLEQSQIPLNPQIIDFTNEYLKQFLSQKMSESSLKNAQVYSLKKFVSEKTLEVMDVLEGNREDYLNWYSLFSSYIARKFPQYMNNKVRLKKDPKEHYLWAKDVPIQHVKSETIVKLHSVYNGLSGI